MFASSLIKLGNFSVAPAEILDSKKFGNCRQYLCLFRILVECTPSRRGQGMMLLLPNRLVSSVLSTLDRFSGSFQKYFTSSTHKKNSPLSRFTKKHSHNLELFPNRVPIELFSNCFSHKSSAKSHDFGHLCLGRRIHISGHSDCGISNTDGASSILTKL